MYMYTGEKIIYSVYVVYMSTFKFDPNELEW